MADDEQHQSLTGGMEREEPLEPKKEEETTQPATKPDTKPDTKADDPPPAAEPKPSPRKEPMETPRKEKTTPRQEKKTTPRAAPSNQTKKGAVSSRVSEADPEETATQSGAETVGRKEQREFFKEELRRLQTGLARESSKIHPPRPRKYTPFIFNTLEPYYNTHTTKFLIELPDENEQFFAFSSRNTAQGLTDPWIDLRMDNEILPQIPGSSRPSTRGDPKVKRKKSQRKATDVNRKEGSTRLPKFPVVNLETKELATKQLFYSDVPMLRKELKTKYSSQAKTKVDADYKRTQADFYRMELDKIEQVAPTNRRHMTSTYMAYLNNTPGSRRAVSECVRTLEGKAN